MKVYAKEEVDRMRDDARRHLQLAVNAINAMDFGSARLLVLNADNKLANRLKVIEKE